MWEARCLEKVRPRGAKPWCEGPGLALGWREPEPEGRCGVFGCKLPPSRGCICRRLGGHQLVPTKLGVSVAAQCPEKSRRRSARASEVPRSPGGWALGEAGRKLGTPSSLSPQHGACARPRAPAVSRSGRGQPARAPRPLSGEEVARVADVVRAVWAPDVRPAVPRGAVRPRAAGGHRWRDEGHEPRRGLRPLGHQLSEGAGCVRARPALLGGLQPPRLLEPSQRQRETTRALVSPPETRDARRRTPRRSGPRLGRARTTLVPPAELCPQEGRDTPKGRGFRHTPERRGIYPSWVHVTGGEAEARAAGGDPSRRSGPNSSCSRSAHRHPAAPNPAR